MFISEESDISLIKGVGAKKAEALRSMGIETVNDLLKYFPVEYRDRGNFKSYSEAAEGEYAILRAMYTGIASGGYARKGFSKSVLTFTDGTDQFDVVLYNQPYIASSLKTDEVYRLYGRFYKNQGRLQLVSPQLEREGTSCFLNEGIYPVYSLPVKTGLRQKEFASFISNALEKAEIYEELPLWMASEMALYSKADSLELIHHPTTLNDAYRGMRYFKLRDFMEFYIHLNETRGGIRQDGYAMDVKKVAEFSDLLDFSLTSAQLRCLKEILRDMASGKQMNRLLQGDVGSGKTMVAVMAAYVAAANGKQSAICAPTEILAKQHYKKYAPYFEKKGYKCGILYSGMKKDIREKMLRAIAAGYVKVVFGTHALFSKDVEYADLGFITIDEQHRFGVAQRAALEEKGCAPHTLVMSATPIPRTLALCMYKDLDVSVIDEMPQGRKEIQTFLINASQTDRAYGYIKKCAERGLKSYIVCPAIDALDMENVSHVYTEAKQALSPYKVAFVTGAMKEDERAKVMDEFSNGDLNVLVATSIVEVGVDVPRAVIMWIRGAERFGLAQLHQLRGRVGRSNIQSYCFLQTDSLSPEAISRLSVLKSTNDGFEIATRDMELRGAGDVFGLRQSGKLPGVMDDALAYPELFMAADGLSRRLRESDDEIDRDLYEELMEESEDMFSSVAFN